MDDIYDIRRANLRKILEDIYEGRAVTLAGRLNKQPNQITRIFTREEKSRRNLGDALAREIEEVSGLDYGWLDHVHTVPDDESFRSLPEGEQKAAIYNELANLSEEDLSIALRMISALRSSPEKQ